MLNFTQSFMCSYVCFLYISLKFQMQAFQKTRGDICFRTKINVQSHTPF
uniref:Uncharacterized protein n=1 Tax=Anguilla anguilla TaxID=7936 RepID=A0A0E9S745_ANGAN